MGSICLSAAPILRCVSLDHIQNVALIIPASLEVVAATTLVYFNWGSGKRHLLLTAEGWMYFVLTLLELLSFIVPAVRDNLSLFRAFDTSIGIVSFLPLFFYTFFLYLFTSGELTETLPNVIRNVAKVAMILFIPAIVVSNEVGSFVGVGVVQEPSGLLQYAFNTKGNEWLWFFFTSLSLAVLVAFQATVFGFSFFRLVHTLVQRRRSTMTSQGRPTLFKGVGWICAAAKLGALETVVGFAGGAFGVAMTRRIIRLLARTCLYIGVVKGVDAVEDFDAIRSSFYQRPNGKSSARKRTGLRPLISNPRLSTFRELSPTAVSFHAALKPMDLPFDGSNPLQRPGSHYTTYTQRQRLSQMPTAGPLGPSQNGLTSFANLKQKRSTQRVTVLYDLRDGAPSLHMRFSSLDMPTPALIANQVKNWPRSAWMPDLEASADVSPALRNIPSPYSKTSNMFEDDTTSEDFLVPRPRFFTEGDQQRTSNVSRDSIGSKSSTVPSQFEIVSASQLTFSQRRAETKLFLTRTPTPSSQLLVNPKNPARSLRGESPSSNLNPSPPKVRIQGAIPHPTSSSRPYSNAPSAYTTDTNLQHPGTQPQHYTSDSSISLQGVRDLATQFPRTPDTSRPSSFHMALTPDPDPNPNPYSSDSLQRRVPLTFWENDSSSVNRDGAASANPSSVPIARAYGSPSELMLFPGNIHHRASGFSVAPTTTSMSSWGDARGPLVPVGPADMEAEAGAEVYAYTPEPLDPFAPSPPPPSRPGSSLDLAKNKNNTLSIITNPSLFETAQHLQNMWTSGMNEGEGDGDGERTPATGFSGYTHFESGVVGVPEGRTIGGSRAGAGAGVGAADDQECLGTGKSEMFNLKRSTTGSDSVLVVGVGMRGTASHASVRLSESFVEKEEEKEGDELTGQGRRRRSLSEGSGSKFKGSSSRVGDMAKQDRLSRLAESEGDDNNNDIVSLARTQSRSKPSATKTRSHPKPKPDDLQNLHDRGTSIDQLAINWVSPSTLVSNLPGTGAPTTSKPTTASKPASSSKPALSSSSSNTSSHPSHSSSSPSRTKRHPPTRTRHKIKSVGAIQSPKPTPRPNPPFTFDRMRTESVHVDFDVHPSMIILPPKKLKGDLDGGVQEADVDIAIDMDMPVSLEPSSSFSGRGILRDSEVLGIEDGLYVPVSVPVPSSGEAGRVSNVTKPRARGETKMETERKAGNYF